MNLVFLFFLIAMAEPTTTCGCRDASDIQTFWGHDNAVVVYQISCDTISGEVKGISGKVLPDALVEIYKLEKLKFGFEWEYPKERVAACITSENGKFCFNDLPSGLYEVRFSKEGFKTLSFEGIRVKPKANKKKKEAVLFPALEGS